MSDSQHSKAFSIKKLNALFYIYLKTIKKITLIPHNVQLISAFDGSTKVNVLLLMSLLPIDVIERPLTDATMQITSLKI